LGRGFFRSAIIIFLFEIAPKNSIIQKIISHESALEPVNYKTLMFEPLRETMKDENQSLKKAATPTRQHQELGLFDTIGSFPVWLIRIIQALTPDSLITKTPPKKKNVRI